MFPALTISMASGLLDVTTVSAQRSVERLIDLGVLEEVTGQQRNRIYVAREILRTANAK